MRWLQTVALPDIEVKAVTHQQLLRSMDALMDNQDAVDGVVAGLLRPLVDRDLSLAFYDMTKHTWSNIKYSRQIFSGRLSGLAKDFECGQSHDTALNPSTALCRQSRHDVIEFYCHS